MLSQTGSRTGSTRFRGERGIQSRGSTHTFLTGCSEIIQGRWSDHWIRKVLGEAAARSMHVGNLNRPKKRNVFNAINMINMPTIKHDILI